MVENVAVRGPRSRTPHAAGGARDPSGCTAVVERWDRRRSHARPNSRQTSHRTYKAGYRDQDHLWSRCFFCFSGSLYRPQRAEPFVCQHCRRHRRVDRFLSAARRRAGGHGSQRRIRKAAVCAAVGAGLAGGFAQPASGAALRRRHGPAGEDRPHRCGDHCAGLRRSKAAYPVFRPVRNRSGSKRWSPGCASSPNCKRHNETNGCWCSEATVQCSFSEVLAVVAAQMRILQAAIAALIAADPLWQKLDQAFRSIKGVADRTVARLMAEVPEIGMASNKAVSKLVGLAPLARDSGKHQGKRVVRGGRRNVRAILFVVAGSGAASRCRFCCFPSTPHRGRKT